ncbi:MAG: pimelyl-ACP methyl ester esterase BioV [Sulfurovum sp.]|nr:pimelyl-ACP methyl ester esterase BioV [Sulfurovum sp.]
MRYFNGFSLRGEERFFSEYLIQSDLCVAGFSYGAQQAVEYVYSTTQRVDRLILLSPAFFQNQKPSFIRTQLRYFKNSREAYIQQFLANAAYPSQVDLSAFLRSSTDEELEALLSYQWENEKIRRITDRGTIIEVFLGSEDKIIDAPAAFDFFAGKTVTYWIKGAGHLLMD